MTTIESQTSAIVPEQQKSKIAYIDHLKVIMIILVILHHSFITYGASGGWYYYQKTSNELAKALMTLFVAVNQSFFMGFFFFLSALFVPSSYDKKGPSRFLKDRFIRLGIPLLFYSFVFSPFLSYLVYYYGKGHHITYWQYLRGFDSWIDFGVLWFVAALLVFNLFYVLYRNFSGNIERKLWVTPSNGKILLFAATLGVLTFVVRLVFPVGWVLKPVGFQLAHFPQYVALFILGLVASRNKWLGAFKYQQVKQMAVVALLAIVIVFPLFYVLLSTLKFPSDWFSGGLHWPALLYAMWEQITGFCIIMVLLCMGKKYLNEPSVILSEMSRSAFAVYIFHPLIVIILALALSDWGIDPAFKLLVMAPLAVSGSFLLGSIIVSIPGVKRII